MKKIFCCPALELFHRLPLWKIELFVRSRAFLLVDNSEPTWKKATKCNKSFYCVAFVLTLIFKASSILFSSNLSEMSNKLDCK